MMHRLAKLFLLLSLILGGLTNSVERIPSVEASTTSQFEVFDIFCIGNKCGTDESSDRKDRFAIGVTQEAEERGISSVAALILTLINILSLLVGSFAMIMVMVAGVNFVTAGGDESQIDRAKAILSQALIGLVMVFGAYFIVTFVTSFFY